MIDIIKFTFNLSILHKDKSYIMKKEIIQIENISAEEFKDEIIKGVVLELKDLIQSISAVQKTDENELLTRHEAAKMLSISLVSLWKIDKSNIIQSYRIGHKVLYKRSELLKVLIQKNKAD
jgi:hypothetical protein